MKTKSFAILAIIAATGVLAISLSSQIVFADSGQSTFSFNDENLHLKCKGGAGCFPFSVHTDNGQHTGQPQP